jgi:hypothetical protein
MSDENQNEQVISSDMKRYSSTTHDLDTTISWVE